MMRDILRGLKDDTVNGFWRLLAKCPSAVASSELRQGPSPAGTNPFSLGVVRNFKQFLFSCQEPTLVQPSSLVPAAGRRPEPPPDAQY
ncbi:hypothetical protein AK812_SmicGene13737 [Symbiodinium microadriaticum]|uniref:Uncharacterized protein n=1 Tax=Symbiodinium microadriaticum TaxID=2951 RepID=A0A1Q9E7D1_SYMMI|nr:hypothetical protein AK812_SmicGene13737 [Symbiodinium microadriaticum]